MERGLSTAEARYSYSFRHGSRSDVIAKRVLRKTDGLDLVYQFEQVPHLEGGGGSTALSSSGIGAALLDAVPVVCRRVQGRPLPRHQPAVLSLLIGRRKNLRTAKGSVSVPWRAEAATQRAVLRREDDACKPLQRHARLHNTSDGAL